MELHIRGVSKTFSNGVQALKDVSELYPKMAIIDEEILLEAEPLGAVDDLRSRIWHRVISKEELPELKREHAMISTKLFAGRTVVHVYSDTAPVPTSRTQNHAGLPESPADEPDRSGP